MHKQKIKKKLIFWLYVGFTWRKYAAESTYRFNNF